MLQFDPFESAVDITFWETLAKNKMEVYRLDDSVLDIQASYEPGKKVKARTTQSVVLMPPRLLVNAAALGPSLADAVPGVFKNTNTLPDFKALDKNAFLKQVAARIWTAIADGSAVRSPNLLSTFGLITFADLKKYKFYYWFSFPALLPDSPFSAGPIEPLDPQ
ncbi:Autophagy protein 7, partial [Kappamyces sp. JEL0680]